MQEYLLNPITLICLGTIFILVSLLFLYFKRHLSFLEKAQMDQARILQSFIANMEMTSAMQQRGSGIGPGPNVSPQMSEQHNENQEELIDVSDDDDSSSDESDSESEDDSVSQEPEVIELSTQPEDISYTNIKVIQLESDNLEEVTNLKIDKLKEISDDSEDESDDESDDDDSDDESNDIINSIIEDVKVFEMTQPVELEVLSVVEQLNIGKTQTVDYKTLNVTSLRELAEGAELIGHGEKRTKKDLIKLLEESK